MKEKIKLTIEKFVKASQRKLYAQQMKAAAADPEFIKRTMETQREFEKSK